MNQTELILVSATRVLIMISGALYDSGSKIMNKNDEVVFKNSHEKRCHTWYIFYGSRIHVLTSCP